MKKKIKGRGEREREREREKYKMTERKKENVKRENRVGKMLII